MTHCFADLIFIGYLHSVSIYYLFIELQSISSLMMPVLLCQYYEILMSFLAAICTKIQKYFFT